MISQLLLKVIYSVFIYKILNTFLNILCRSFFFFKKSSKSLFGGSVFERILFLIFRRSVANVFFFSEKSLNDDYGAREKYFLYNNDGMMDESTFRFVEYCRYVDSQFCIDSASSRAQNLRCSE
jgi:hypothetical protein